VKNATAKPVRCAIYTRVSTDHGLEQDFNSLDAQHDAAQSVFMCHSARRQERVWRAERPGARIDAIAT
jgi:hypothetical protein